MGFYFESPEVKKWKRLFLLSIVFNVVLFVLLVAEYRGAKDTHHRVDSVAEKSVSETPKRASNESKAVLSKKKEIPDNRWGEPIVVKMRINDNFYNTFYASERLAKLKEVYHVPNLPEVLSAHVARLVMWDIDLRRDIRKGDTIEVVFRLIPEKERLKRDDLPDELEVLALAYHSKKYVKTFRIYRFKASDSKFARYYYDDGTLIEPQLRDKPIKDYIQVTALLHDRRPRHDGVDFKAPIGTPVYATVNGRVSRKNWKTRYNGYCVEIEMKGKPYTFKYLHLEKVAVQVGQRVKKGQVIAYSGNTGRSTAPHLHYQINLGRKGRVIDPFKFHETYKIHLSRGDMGRFKDTIIKMNDLLRGSR